MLADTYIILKEYENALEVLNSMDYAMDLKKALIYIKLKDFQKAALFLRKAKEQNVNPNTKVKILDTMIYSGYKATCMIITNILIYTHILKLKFIILG